VFGRSGFAEGQKDGADSKGSEGNSTPKPKQEGTSSGSGEQPQAESAPDPKVQGAQGASDAIRRQEAGFSVPGIERPAYDRAASDQAWQGMHARSQMSPPTAKAVASAMGEFPAETQRGIAAYQQANPTRMRQWAAQHVGAAGLSDSQRSALLTIGSAPKAALEKGVGQALAVVDARPASVPEQPAKPSGAPATPAAGTGAAQPSSEQQRSAGESRGLGSALEQPPSTSGGAGQLPDPEPFLD
jgi:hypothetical protein